MKIKVFVLTILALRQKKVQPTRILNFREFCALCYKLIAGYTMN